MALPVIAQEALPQRVADLEALTKQQQGDIDHLKRELAELKTKVDGIPAPDVVVATIPSEQVSVQHNMHFVANSSGVTEIFVAAVGGGTLFERIGNLVAVSPDVVPFDMAGKRAGQLHIVDWNITLDTSGIHYQCSGKDACDALHIIGFK